MAAKVETIITCDLGTSSECERVYTTDHMKGQSAHEQRSRYGLNGWKCEGIVARWRIVGYKDFCPKCLEELNSN